MNRQSHRQRDALDRLLMLQVEGELSAPDRIELAELLRDNPEAQSRYANYVALHAWLDWDRADAPNDAGGEIGDAQAETVDDQLSPRRTWVGSGRYLVRVFGRPIPLSLLIAIFVTPVLFIGMLALVVPQWLAATNENSELAGSGVVVARLSAVHQAKWADATTVRPEGSQLRQGQILMLREGLIEITFNQGATVVLAGPAEFEISTTNSGRLKTGSLTSVVPRAAIGFEIRTPQATIVDLGTEFGVALDESGATNVSVFAGAVQLTTGPPKEDVTPSTTRRLTAGESVRIDTSGRIKNTPTDNELFVREMPQSASIRLLAEWRMGEDDANAQAGRSAGTETVDSTGHRALARSGEPTYVEQTAIDSSSLAVEFTGEASQRFTAQRVATTRADNWLLEAWARADSTSGVAIVVYNGDSSRSGYGIVRSGDGWQGVFGGVAVLDFYADVETGKWTHLALLRHNGSTRFLVDGMQVGNELKQQPRVPRGGFMIGGNPADDQQTFDGAIDNVRLSILSADFEMDMLQK